MQPFAGKASVPREMTHIFCAGDHTQGMHDELRIVSCLFDAGIEIELDVFVCFEVKTMAENLGYSNPSALSRAFKAKTGLSPRD